MDLIATVLGLIVLLWIFVGPLVGYVVRDRGWRFRSPFTRIVDDEADL